VKPGAALALQPLYLLTAGVTLSAAAAHWAVDTGPAPVLFALTAAGVMAVLWAARAGSSRRAAILWLMAGLALGSARGLYVREHQLQDQKVFSTSRYGAVRFKARIESSWTPTRWGRRCDISLIRARTGHVELHLPRRLRLETRGTTPAEGLPPPGSLCSGLASLRGDPARPFLAVASARLLNVLSPPSGLAAMREHGAASLLAAAGTDPGRIRAAELASALVFGRRDLMPTSQRNRWRRSGLAHVLAVSGLHVGLLAGLVWLLAIALGASPNLGRGLVLALVPSYAILAGASPSAVRAAIMVAVYVAARMVGRPLVPMAAVLLAATAMLLVDPTLIATASFQLTVGITAALVRWVRPATELLPLPLWLGAAVAVPVIAQLAAAPIVAWHFRTLIPGAVLANLLMPLFLAPLLVAAFGAALLSFFAPAAGLALSVLHILSGMTLACGAPARARLEIVPTLPVALMVMLAMLALLALWPGSHARIAAVVWVLLVLLSPLAWRLLPTPVPPGPLLLPVRDGLAALLPAPRGPILADGGRLPDEAARLLADLRIRKLGAIIASHTDEDHIGGLPTVIRTLKPRQVLFPAWMTTDPAVVSLLRAARRVGASVVPLARGLRIDVAGDGLHVLWPPFLHPPFQENDRSLVAKLAIPQGAVLLTSDVSSTVERRLILDQAPLDADILIAGHHGSAGSSSSPFLLAVRPHCVLVPAGPWNSHHHPSQKMIRRLRRLRLPWRTSKDYGWCGARMVDHRWRCWP